MSDIFNDKNEIKSTWVKWGKIGDFITGTLVDVREINSQLPGKEGERVKVYEIKAESGQIGRASCRERVQISVVAVALKKKRKKEKEKEKKKKKK